VPVVLLTGWGYRLQAEGKGAAARGLRAQQAPKTTRVARRAGQARQRANLAVQGYPSDAIPRSYTRLHMNGATVEYDFGLNEPGLTGY
jgi:hypothetical protein